MMLEAGAFFALLLAAAREGLRQGGADRFIRQAGLALIALAIGAFGIGYMTAGGADWLLALALTAAVPPLLRPADRVGDFQIGVIAAFAAASKMEGVPLAAFLVLVQWARHVLGDRAPAGAPGGDPRGAPRRPAGRGGGPPLAGPDAPPSPLPGPQLRPLHPLAGARNPGGRAGGPADLRLARLPLGHVPAAAAPPPPADAAVRGGGDAAAPVLFLRLFHRGGGGPDPGLRPLELRAARLPDDPGDAWWRPWWRGDRSGNKKGGDSSPPFRERRKIRPPLSAACRPPPPCCRGRTGCPPRRAPGRCRRSRG